MSLTRIIVRRADDFATRECDVGEPFYDGNLKTIGIGDGSTTPPRMLTENNPQTMTNKVIDAELNTITNIDPLTNFVDAQFIVSLLGGVTSNLPIKGSISAVAPILDQNAVNQLNANFSEIKVKINEIIQLLQKLNLSK